MIRCRFFLVALLTYGLFSERAVGQTQLLPLQTGDILLQSIQCYVCSLIEIEENSKYSHSGVVLEESGELYVLEAWGKVAKNPLSEFLGKRTKDTRTRIIRPRISIDSFALKAAFEKDFAGKEFDPGFFWEEVGGPTEKLYCSELIAKLLNPFMPVPILPKAMHFNQFRETWIQYFKGPPPDGKPGLSPEDFNQSPLFIHIGEL